MAKKQQDILDRARHEPTTRDYAMASQLLTSIRASSKTTRANSQESRNFPKTIADNTHRQHTRFQAHLQIRTLKDTFETSAPGNETIHNHNLITIPLTFIILYFSTITDYVCTLIATQHSHFTRDTTYTHTDHYIKSAFSVHKSLLVSTSYRVVLQNVVHLIKLFILIISRVI